MSAWVLVPSLVALREEFNRLNPSRDKGADGSIGDSAHTSSSDHTPDEDSDVLRDHDADSKNEVHALDIDSTGPWPGLSFEDIVMGIVAREKKRWNDPNDVCRLEYVIWDHHIYSRAYNFAPRAYTLSDPHTNHGHFSSRYLTTSENDTSPWGVEEEDFLMTMFEDKTEFTAYMVSLLQTQVPEALKDALTGASATDKAIQAAFKDLSKDGARQLYVDATNAKRAQVVAADGSITYATGRSAAYDQAGTDGQKEMRNAYDFLKELGIAVANEIPTPTSSQG